MKAKTPEGCEECLRDKTMWTSLRKCLSCGHVGCCDTSLNKHARKHFEQTGHPLMTSHPDESWKWCYIDDTYIE